MTLKYRNFKAWLYCEDDREILEEFQASPDPEDDRTYMCWVASEAGKRFAIHWESLMKDVCDNRGVVSVDGVETHSYVDFKSSAKIATSSGVKTADGGTRPYSFSNVLLTDDDTYLGIEQSTDADELGSITIKIYLVDAHFEAIRRPNHRKRRPFQKREINLYEGAIHETSKKICDHRITLGETVSYGPPRPDRPPTRKLKWELYDSSDTAPHVVFRFKYRPRAYLQAQGIIPRPSSIHDSKSPCKTSLSLFSSLSAKTGQAAGQKLAGKKRKRPLRDRGSSQRNIGEGRTSTGLPLFLPTPTPQKEPSQATQTAPSLRSVFFVTPCRMKQDDDIILLGYSETRIKQENVSPSMCNVRARLGPNAPMKLDSSANTSASGMRLWMDNHGIIDLTNDA